MGQDAVEAQRFLAALMAGLQPLIPFVSPVTCQVVTDALLVMLEEALNAQEAGEKKGGELKQLTPKDLLQLGRQREAAKTPQTGAAGDAPSVPKRAKKVAKDPKNAGADANQGKPKRARKPVVLDGNEDEDGADTTPSKKVVSKKPPKKAKPPKEAVAWSAAYAIITAVTGVTGAGADVRVDVLAKKAGRGCWQSSPFFLDAQSLVAIDALREDLSTFVKSFQEAANAFYGGNNWPKELVAALQSTMWARDMVPATGDCDFPNLDLAVGDAGGMDFQL